MDLNEAYQYRGDVSLLPCFVELSICLPPARFNFRCLRLRLSANCQYTYL